MRSVVPLQFQFVNAKFRCCVMNSVTQVELTSKNLQYQICSKLLQRLSSYETVQKITGKCLLKTHVCVFM